MADYAMQQTLLQLETSARRKAESELKELRAEHLRLTRDFERVYTELQTALRDRDHWRAAHAAAVTRGTAV